MFAESKSYRGVSCVWCGEPIPVSAKAVSLQDEIEQGEANAPYAFVVRCQLCEYESVYEIRCVKRLDGEPPRRRGRARARAA